MPFPNPATKFKKGTTGNPKGRPPKLPQLDVLLAKVLGDETNGRTAAEQIIAALKAKAAKGDVRAAEVLMDRAYGKALQRTDITSRGERIVVPPIQWTDEGTP